MSSTCARLQRILALGVAAPALALSACGGGDEARAPEAGADPPVGGETAAPWFEELAAERGLDFEHASGADGRFLMPEIMTTGAARDGDVATMAERADGASASARATLSAVRRPNMLMEGIGGIVCT